MREHRRCTCRSVATTVQAARDAGGIQTDAKGSTLDDEDLMRRLDAHGTTAPVSSKVARLRRLYEHIQAALCRGASRQEVLNELNADGFDMTLDVLQVGAATHPGGAERD